MEKLLNTELTRNCSLKKGIITSYINYNLDRHAFVFLLFLAIII